VGAERWTDLSPLAIYFTTRIATLMAVVLALIGINLTADTIVRCVHSAACFTCDHKLIVRDPKVETIFELVSKPRA